MSPVAISLRLPDDLAQSLDQIARETERSRSQLILKALKTYLAEYADYQIALDRYRDVGDEVLSAAEMRRRLATKD